MASLDTLWFVATAGLVWLHKRAKAASACDASELQNSAFVFVKPQANTAATQALVRNQLVAAGIQILSEVDISGQEIDDKKLIDQHYYAIASKATILPAKDLPVPADKFQEAFGESWETVVQEGRACNAMEACQRFACNAEQLDEAWGQAKVTKFGGGFYCGLVKYKGKELYVFNAFFMTMRSKFVGAGKSIHCYEVSFSPKKVSWEAFRNEILGPTDPADAPKGSLRNTILTDYKALGLESVPNKGDNGVHASASPFEGLAEKMNWLGKTLADDPFGAALLRAGLSDKTIMEWSVDPRITISESGEKGSVFDALEDLDVDECLAKMVQLNEYNADTI